MGGLAWGFAPFRRRIASAADARRGCRSHPSPSRLLSPLSLACRIRSARDRNREGIAFGCSPAAPRMTERPTHSRRLPAQLSACLIPSRVSPSVLRTARSWSVHRRREQRGYAGFVGAYIEVRAVTFKPTVARFVCPPSSRSSPMSRCSSDRQQVQKRLQDSGFA